MNRLGVAFRAFFVALGNRQRADQIEAALDGRALPQVEREVKPQLPAARPEPAAPARSEALTLLAALQREARLVDLVKEPLAQYSDEQIGAAARNVLGDCAAVLDRFFGLAPLAKEDEGASVEVPGHYDPARYKLTGQVAGNGPFRGRLMHRGWRATALKLPAWTGSKDAADIVAPSEIEL